MTFPASPERSGRPGAARRVTGYTAAGCRLCGPAVAAVREVQSELGLDVEVVDVTGDPVLEAAYRALLPVVEIDGERAFTHAVDPDDLRDRLA